ncbi:hypothetical protein D1871_06940 [Nakamurella silvestris]|nr:hypothetical protein D1871_06940 [Nakamurella silvestris]
MRFSRTQLGGLALAVVVSLTAAPETAGASTGAAGSPSSVPSSHEIAAVPGVPDSGALTGDVVLAGTVTADSRPVAGALVVAYAWPRNDVWDATSVGRTYTMLPVAQARTDADGHYDLRVFDPRSLDPFRNDDGAVNVSLTATANGKTQVVDQVLRDAGQQTTGESEVMTDDSAMTAAPAANDGSIDLNGPGSMAPDTIGGVVQPAQGSCSSMTTTNVANLPPGWVIVGQSFSGTAYVKANFKYTSGATSEFGVAASTTGAEGTWTANVGVTTSTAGQSETDFPTKTGKGKYFYETTFNSSKFKLGCYHYNTTQWTYSYQVRATDQFGGAKAVSTTNTSGATECIPYNKGTTLRVNKSKAITWSNGFQINSPIATVALSSRTGYSTSAELDYTQIKDIQLCGKGGGPASTTALTVGAKAL